MNKFPLPPDVMYAIFEKSRDMDRLERRAKFAPKISKFQTLLERRHHFWKVVLYDEDDDMTLDPSKATLIERWFTRPVGPRIYIWHRFSGEESMEIPESRFRSVTQVFAYNADNDNDDTDDDE
jgi:hypothetical protein